MLAINQIANAPCPLAEREQRITELEREIDRLQRTEEAIVVATGAPRERGCPPWVVLGVKTVEVRTSEQHEQKVLLGRLSAPGGRRHTALDGWGRVLPDADLEPTSGGWKSRSAARPGVILLPSIE